MNTPAQLRHWAAGYPVSYDVNYYAPHILSARAGNIPALERMTEWKNPGRGNPPKPMCLSAKKAFVFNKFTTGLCRYLAPAGDAALRADFSKSAPVYAIFWHHVLFGTPIFDIHTNRAFQYFATGTLLKGRAAGVPRGGHWNLYDAYTTWFNTKLSALQSSDPTITDRDLDRALMQWGIAHK